MKQISQERWIKIFKEFMKKEGVWKRYVDSAREEVLYKSVEFFLFDTEPEGFINHAFNWSDDKIVDWGDVDAGWQEYIAQALKGGDTDIDDAEAKDKNIFYLNCKPVEVIRVLVGHSEIFDLYPQNHFGMVDNFSILTLSDEMGEEAIKGLFCEMYEDDEHLILTGGMFIPHNSSVMIAVRYV